MKTTSLVRASRIKFYSHSKLNVTDELLDTFENSNPHYQIVLKILDLRFNEDPGIYQVLVKWRGFFHEETKVRAFRYYAGWHTRQVATIS